MQVLRYISFLILATLFESGNSVQVAEDVVGASSNYAPIFSKEGHGECISDSNLDIKEVLGDHSHTIHIEVDMPTSHDGGARQWILNLGHEAKGAHHWIWNSNEKIQFGMWQGTQISDADIRSCSFLTTTYGDGVLKLYCNGVLIGSKTASFNIQNSKLVVGTDSCHFCATPGGGADFQGCVKMVKVWNRKLSADEVRDLASEECSIDGFWHPNNYPYFQGVTEGVVSNFPSHGPGTGTLNDDGTVHWIWHNTNREHRGIFSDDCTTITWENGAQWFEVTDEARFTISEEAQHCDDACAEIGEECRDDMLYLTTAEQVESWALAVGVKCASIPQRCDMGDSPVMSGDVCTFCNNPDHPGWTTRNPCRSRWHGRQRLCACTSTMEPEPESIVQVAADVVAASSTFSFEDATYFFAAVGVLSSAYMVVKNLTSNKYAAITEENEV